MKEALLEKYAKENGPMFWAILVSIQRHLLAEILHSMLNYHLGHSGHPFIKVKLKLSLCALLPAVLSAFDPLAFVRCCGYLASRIDLLLTATDPS